MTARKTTSATAPRQTQKGVARAATARKTTASNAAKVSKINAAKQQVEQVITDVLNNKTTESAARKQLDTIVKESEKRSTATSKATASNAAKVSSINTTRKGAADRVRQLKEAIASGMPEAEAAHKFGFATAADVNAHVEKVVAARTAKTTAKKSAPTKSVNPKIETLASELASIEGAILAAGLTERALADDPMGKKRNELIVKLIKLDAGYSFIAKTRNVAPSTNRGLCRVLEGGKRI